MFGSTEQVNPNSRQPSERSAEQPSNTCSVWAGNEPFQFYFVLVPDWSCDSSAPSLLLWLAQSRGRLMPFLTPDTRCFTFNPNPSQLILPRQILGHHLPAFIPWFLPRGLPSPHLTPPTLSQQNSTTLHSSSPSLEVPIVWLVEHTSPPVPLDKRLFSSVWTVPLYSANIYFEYLIGVTSGEQKRSDKLVKQTW